MVSRRPGRRRPRAGSSPPAAAPADRGRHAVPAIAPPTRAAVDTWFPAARGYRGAHAPLSRRPAPAGRHRGRRPRRRPAPAPASAGSACSCTTRSASSRRSVAAWRRPAAAWAPRSRRPRTASAGCPLVGGELAEQLRSAGRGTGGEIVAAGQEGEQRVHELARTLGWLTFVVPGVLLLILYVPGRAAQVRRLTAGARALRAPAAVAAAAGHARRLLAPLSGAPPPHAGPVRGPRAGRVRPARGGGARGGGAPGARRRTSLPADARVHGHGGRARALLRDVRRPRTRRPRCS